MADDKASAGMVSVNLPSAERSVPPDGPIVVSDSTPVGVPISVIIGPLSSATEDEPLFLHDIKKVVETRIMTDNLRNMFVVFIAFRFKIKYKTG